MVSSDTWHLNALHGLEKKKTVLARPISMSPDFRNGVLDAPTDLANSRRLVASRRRRFIDNGLRLLFHRVHNGFKALDLLDFFGRRDGFEGSRHETETGARFRIRGRRRRRRSKSASSIARSDTLNPHGHFALSDVESVEVFFETIDRGFRAVDRDQLSGCLEGREVVFFDGAERGP